MQTGLITKLNNPKELAKNMDFLIKNKDKKEIQKRNDDSIKFAKAHNDWDKNIRELEEWLRR